MGWREPEAQDIGKVVFNRAFTRHAAEHVGGEMTNVYFDEAMKDKPEAAWEALLKEVLKGDSKKIWHGELMETCSSYDEELHREVYPCWRFRKI